jgi:hypothetical protein
VVELEHRLQSLDHLVQEVLKWRSLNI